MTLGVLPSPDDGDWPPGRRRRLPSNGPATAAVCVVTKQTSVIQVTQRRIVASYPKSVSGRCRPPGRGVPSAACVPARSPGSRRRRSAGNCRPARNCRWRKATGRYAIAHQHEGRHSRDDDNDQACGSLGHLPVADQASPGRRWCAATRWRNPEDDRRLGACGGLVDELQRGLGT